MAYLVRGYFPLQHAEHSGEEIKNKEKKKREWITPTEATAQPHYLSKYRTHRTCHHLPKVSVLRARYLAALHERHLGKSQQ